MRIHTTQLSSLAEDFQFFDFNNVPHLDLNKALLEKDKFSSPAKFLATIKLHHIIMQELSNPNVYINASNDRQIIIMDCIHVALDNSFPEIQSPLYKHFHSCIIQTERALYNPLSYASFADLRNGVHSAPSKDDFQKYNYMYSLLNVNSELYSLISFFLLTQIIRFNKHQRLCFSALKKLRPKAYPKYDHIEEKPYLLSNRGDVIPVLCDPESAFFISEQTWAKYFRAIRDQTLTVSGIDPKSLTPYYGQEKFEYNKFIHETFLKEYPDQVSNISSGNPRKMAWIEHLLEANLNSHLTNRFLISSIIRDEFWGTSNCFKWTGSYRSYDYDVLEAYFNLPEPIYSLMTFEKLLKFDSLSIPIFVHQNLVQHPVNAYDENVYLVIRHALYVVNHNGSSFRHGNSYSFKCAINSYCRSLLTLYGQSIKFKHIVADVYKHFDILVSPIFPDIAKRFNSLESDGHSITYYADLLKHKHINYVLKVYESEGEAKAKANERKSKYKAYKKRQTEYKNFNDRLNNDAEFRNEYYNARHDDKCKNTGSRSSNERSSQLHSSFIHRANGR